MSLTSREKGPEIFGRQGHLRVAQDPLPSGQAWSIANPISEQVREVVEAGGLLACRSLTSFPHRLHPVHLRQSLFQLKDEPEGSDAGEQVKVQAPLVLGVLEDSGRREKARLCYTGFALSDLDVSGGLPLLI